GSQAAWSDAEKQAVKSATDGTGNDKDNERGLIFNTLDIGVGAAAGSKPNAKQTKEKSPVASQGRVKAPSVKPAEHKKLTKTATPPGAKAVAKAKLQPGSAINSALSSDSDYVTVSHQVDMGSGDGSVVLKATLNKAGAAPK